MFDGYTANGEPFISDRRFVHRHGSKPYGLSIPKYLHPAWMIKRGDCYSLFVWCDEHQRWNEHGRDTLENFEEEATKGLVLEGGTIEARCAHHDGHREQFFAMYNFGLAPKEIQWIGNRYPRVHKVSPNIKRILLIKKT